MKQICALMLAMIMTVQVSAYTPHECGGNRITASGAECQEGVTVAFNGLPLGAVIEYEGHQYVVQDRCGIDGVVDIFMESYDKAIKFGRRHNQVLRVIRLP
jgi:3D (Asp-Asp-Asp) domain-containing protein